MVLARDEVDLPGPGAGWIYQPKLDGWRALLFTASGFLQSRRNNNLADRFPEIVRAGRALGDLVLDGELVALREGKLDFGALTTFPPGRTAAGITVYFIAFDLLASGEVDLREQPHQVRHDLLRELFAGVAPPLQLIPTTSDRSLALDWLQPSQAAIGIEGVVAKDGTKPYRVGRTGDWRKVRSTIVVDAVTIGVTGNPARPEALVLARPDPTGTLQLIGLSLPLPPALRDAAAELVTPTGELSRLPGHILGHPGSDFQPVHPTLVVEVEGQPTITTFTGRLRPRVHRLRPDLTPADVEPPS
jgi:ATP-dependent DNA ligase